jgi:FkbM family methyltransferase
MIVQLRKPPIHMHVRSAMDIWSIKETFFDAFYTKIGSPVQNGWFVVDIGAGIGDFSIKAAYGKPDTQVFAFEPFPDSHKLLLENLKINKIDNVKPFQKAVWHRDGKLSLDRSIMEPLQMTSDEINLPDPLLITEEVDAISLNTFCRQEYISKIDLLKLDCEGAEYPIILQSPPEIFMIIDRIVMEYHDLNEQKNHQHLIAYLEELGYKVQQQQNNVHDYLGYLYAEKV